MVQSFVPGDHGAKAFFDEHGWVLVETLDEQGVERLRQWIDEISAQRPSLVSVYVLNQIDSTVSLNRDVSEVLRQHLGKRLARIGIHRDEAVSEALAFQQPVLSYDPHSQATQDVKRLAGWLMESVN